MNEEEAEKRAYFFSEMKSIFGYNFNLIVEEFPFLSFPLTPALSPVCGGEGKGEGAYLELQS